MREAVGLFDVSHMGEAYLRGPRAREVVAKLATNAVESAPAHKAVYTILCHPSGGCLLHREFGKALLPFYPAPRGRIIQSYPATPLLLRR